jgi:hypothetical protein
MENIIDPKQKAINLLNVNKHIISLVFPRINKEKLHRAAYNVTSKTVNEVLNDYISFDKKPKEGYDYWIEVKKELYCIC